MSQETSMNETTKINPPTTSIDLSKRITENDGNTSLKITTVSFNGKNYMAWSKAMFIALCGRGRIGFINGDILPPTVSEAYYPVWHMYDHQVMSWLLNSIDTELHDLFNYTANSKELWDAVKSLYSQ